MDREVHISFRVKKREEDSAKVVIEEQTLDRLKFDGHEQIVEAVERFLLQVGTSIKKIYLSSRRIFRNWAKKESRTSTSRTGSKSAKLLKANKTSNKIEGLGLLNIFSKKQKSGSSKSTSASSIPIVLITK